MISSAQFRAARDLLRWTARELARRAIVSVSTVNLIENAEGVPSVTSKQVEAVQAALEQAGIEFLNGDTPGVRLHAKGASKRKRRTRTQVGRLFAAKKRAQGVAAPGEFSDQFQREEQGEPTWSDTRLYPSI